MPRGCPTDTGLNDWVISNQSPPVKHASGSQVPGGRGGNAPTPKPAKSLLMDPCPGKETLANFFQDVWGLEFKV